MLEPETVRRIQLRLFHDPAMEYLRTGPHDHLEPRKILQRIRNVKSKKVRRVIEAVDAFDGDDEQSIPGAWSNYVAAAAGTHVWPDADHRTAFLAFAVACVKAFQVEPSLPPKLAGDLVKASKAMRDRDFLARGRYYSVAELADEAHPYRALFRRYEPRLVLERADVEP